MKSFKPEAEVGGGERGSGCSWRETHVSVTEPDARFYSVRLEPYHRTAGKTMLGGVERLGAQFTLTLAAYNLARLPKLLAA
jgi:hypothetical protein